MLTWNIYYLMRFKQDHYVCFLLLIKAGQGKLFNELVLNIKEIFPSLHSEEINLEINLETVIFCKSSEMCHLLFAHCCCCMCFGPASIVWKRHIQHPQGRHDQITGRTHIGSWRMALSLTSCMTLTTLSFPLFRQKPDSSLFFLYPMFKPSANLVWFDLQNKSRIWSLLIFSTATKMAQANVISRLDYYHSFLTGWIRLLQRNRQKEMHKYIEKDVLWRLAHRVMEVSLFAVCKLETQES